MKGLGSLGEPGPLGFVVRIRLDVRHVADGDRP